MPIQPEYSQTAQKIWALSIYEFIRQIPLKQVDEPVLDWVPLNKPGTIPAELATLSNKAPQECFLSLMLFRDSTKLVLPALLGPYLPSTNTTGPSTYFP